MTVVALVAEGVIDVEVEQVRSSAVSAAFLASEEAEAARRSESPPLSSSLASTRAREYSTRTPPSTFFHVLFYIALAAVCVLSAALQRATAGDLFGCVSTPSSSPPTRIPPSCPPLPTLQRRSITRQWRLVPFHLSTTAPARRCCTRC